MNASYLLPSRFRWEHTGSYATSPSWLNKKITSLLQVISRIASFRPIHTVVIFAALASTSYIGLLRDSFIDATRSTTKADWSSLIEGSRTMRTSLDTAWAWQTHDVEVSLRRNATNGSHLALLTLVFPQSASAGTSWAPSVVASVPVFENLSITVLPSTSHSFAPYVPEESALTLSVPYNQAPDFLSAALEIPHDVSSYDTKRSQRSQEKKIWIMKAVRGPARLSLAKWTENSWVEFRTLFKHAQTLDVVIMVLSYGATLVTFASLFVSLRRMGSNFWVAAGVLFSSAFSFLFGLFVTAKLGVPITLLLLTEGMPFLVVIVSFEKYILLTRAVLSHAIRMAADKGSEKLSKEQEVLLSFPQSALEIAIREKGFAILKAYTIEIGVLVFGAASSVQGGLQQFCFFSAWVLLFDLILLFSFYAAILCIKLEINRFKRHVETRQVLEDDGISSRVAENVAQSNDWPTADGGHDTGATLFGRQISSAHVSTFKFVMVAGFFAVNGFNLYIIPFRSTSSWAQNVRGLVAPPSADPLKVASHGLDILLTTAKTKRQETIVTVLSPIRYELEAFSVRYGLTQTAAKDGWYAFSDLGGYGISGLMVGGVLKSLEDPILSKLILVALVLSVAFNGYLFNAAVVGIKDANASNRPIDTEELAQAQKFNDTESATIPLREYLDPPSRSAQFAPASTNDDTDTALQTTTAPLIELEESNSIRSPEHMEKLLRAKRVHELLDEEVVELAMHGKIPGYALEKTLKDFTRAVRIRRIVISRTKATADLTGALQYSKLPYQDYNWARVFGACCENVVGYMPVPVGIAGPLVIDGKSYFIPMATTEGVLVASTSRGCKAINSGGGAVTVVTADGMTRGPCVNFERVERAGAAKLWLDSDKGQAIMKKAFNSTSRFARLVSIKATLAGTHLFIRFRATTGDAMGMNMISKGAEHALYVMMSEGFEDMDIVSLSGNYCTDKKASAINWIEGRGKSVVAEAIIPCDVMKSVLKTDVDSIVKLNRSKNLIGSAMAGSVGGFNAHAANIVAAMFIATGQDPAQVVESSNCITIMENVRGSLQISVSMPSLEVGTLGGGTILEPQGAMLDMLGVHGPHPTNPGDNARRLARIMAAVTLAGELSLCSALAAGHLVQAHMQLNRLAPPTRVATPATQAPTPATSTAASRILAR